MQAIPQPSGWPDFGFGCGHPKSRKFLPVSARARNTSRAGTVCVVRAEKQPRPDGDPVFRGERVQAVSVPLAADGTRPRRLAGRDAELDPGYGPDERFVDVLRVLDEVLLTEDHIQPARVLDRDEFRFHGHRQCIESRELKSSSPRSGGTLRARARERASASHRSRMAGIKGLWTILGNVGDPAEREDLALVATAIQVHFASRVARERSVVEFMAIRFRWPASRTRRRLGALVELGVLRMSRDLADNWTKVFEVVDRPHVPAAIALELGA